MVNASFDLLENRTNIIKASILRQIVAGPRLKHADAGLDLCYVTDNSTSTVPHIHNADINQSLLRRDHPRITRKRLIEILQMIW